MKSLLLASLATTISIASLCGQGMPVENRDTIHELLGAHSKITREVKLTDDGYTSTTTSEDKHIVKALQRHVDQMEARMKKGLMVRGFDPAYVEFVSHYDDMEITITDIDNGVSVVAKGKTEAAKKVIRNHAGIISKFVANGMDEAHKAHAAALGKDAEQDDKAPDDETPNQERACCQDKTKADCCKNAKPNAKEES